VGRVYPWVGSGWVGSGWVGSAWVGQVTKFSVLRGSDWVVPVSKISNKCGIYTQETDYSTTIICNDKKL